MAVVLFRSLISRAAYILPSCVPFSDIWLWKCARRAFVAIYSDLEWIVARIRMLIPELCSFTYLYWFCYNVYTTGCVTVAVAVCVRMYLCLCFPSLYVCAHHSLDRNKNKSIGTRLFSASYNTVSQPK